MHSLIISHLISNSSSATYTTHISTYHLSKQINILLNNNPQLHFLIITPSKLSNIQSFLAFIHIQNFVITQSFTFIKTTLNLFCAFQNVFYKITNYITMSPINISLKSSFVNIFF